MTSQTNTEQPAKAAMIGMAGCYAMGNFTDNFFKQAAVLMAAGLGLTQLQSLATVLFALPFILFSAWAGWLADQAQKKNIVIGAKVLELGALTLGALALWAAWWPGILAVIFIMAVQSTVFLPALNGAIPENFAVQYVPRVNSIIRTISTAAILAGMALAGPLLDLRPGSLLPSVSDLDGTQYGRLAAGLFAVAFSVVGLLLAFSIKRQARPISVSRPFPWSGPVDSFKHLLETRRDRALFTVMTGDAFFYGLAPIVVISIANFSKQLGYSDTLSSLLAAALMVGIAIGALLAGRSTPDSWRRFMIPALTCMAACLSLVALTPVLPQGGRLFWFALCLLCAGIAGGIYLIPITSFMQVRPKAGEKGKVLGTSNFYSFVSMAVFGAGFMLIRLLPPRLTFLFYGALTLFFAYGWVLRQLRGLECANLKEEARSPLGSAVRALLSLRYKVRESGLEDIAADPQGGKRPILFLPNHPALIDPFIVYSRIAGLRPRPLSDEKRMSGPLEKLLVRKLRIITIPDAKRDGKGSLESIRKGLNNITGALKNGDNVLLYPAGRIYRSANEELGANSAVAHILRAVPEARVILVRTSGLWGSAFSRAGGRSPQFFGLLLRRLPALLGSLIFFGPRRKVDVDFMEAASLPSDKMELNRWLEDYYNQTASPAIKVPYWIGQSSAPVELPEAARDGKRGAVTELSDEDKNRVLKVVREAACLDAEIPLEPAARLSADLGLDSLSLLELASALEGEFGQPVTELENLITVEDCFAAVSAREEASAAAFAPAPKWFAAESHSDAKLPAYLPDGCNNLALAFLRQFRRGPGRAMLADRAGVKTRSQALISALALSKSFKKLSGSRLGLMLPATPAAPIVWLAAQLAGKEAVMLNWTVGRRNFEHCVKLAGLKHIVTSSALLTQLRKQGTELETEADFVFLEETAAALSRWQKLGSFLQALCYRVTGLGISTSLVPENAVILFTSGSESMPKGVPLTHENILSNAAEVVETLAVTRDVSVLAMLPPFHSFGFIVGITLPLLAGLRVAYHPNPTESAALVTMVSDFRLGLLGATPTFLESMLSRARGDELSSLRYAFVGAERCPDHLHDLFAARCPNGSVCEGYGITECSPVIAVNRPGKAVRGSIGAPLPSVECAVVSEAGKPLALSPGETGMLLVRGRSIFGGYLGSSANPFVEYLGKKWYRTGDLVEQAENGLLFFKGRLSRFVKVAGEMISLPQMESALQEALLPHAPEGGKPFIAVEAEEAEGRPVLTVFATLELNVARINQILREAGLSLIYQVRDYVRLSELPLLGTGKIDYRALKAMLREKYLPGRAANDNLTPAPALK